MSMIVRFATVAFLVLVAAASIAAEGATAQPAAIKRTILNRTEVPHSNYEVVVVLVEVPANTKVGRHAHPGAVVGYVVEGELTVVIDGKPPRVLKADDTLDVPAGAIHDEFTEATNAKAVVVFTVEKGKQLSTPAHQHSADHHSPYAEQQDRQIAALSADDTAALLAGKGMGLAKAAELNGYPGPMHVLELASELQLTAAQKEATQNLYAQMKAAASSLGQEIVEKERSLDDLFSREISERSLTQAVAEIGTLQAQLRAVHLRAHLAQTKMLTTEQIARYNQLRGYRSHQSASHHGP
jgi:quercetin dioxygenase-like cupin family protein